VLLVLGLPSLVWVWYLENFPKNLRKISIFFPFGSKKSHQVRSISIRIKDGLASFLLQVKSVLGSGKNDRHTVMKTSFLYKITLNFDSNNY